MIKQNPVRLKHSEPQTLGEAMLMAFTFAVFLFSPFGVGIIAALLA